MDLNERIPMENRNLWKAPNIYSVPIWDHPSLEALKDLANADIRFIDKFVYHTVCS